MMQPLSMGWQFEKWKFGILSFCTKDTMTIKVLPHFTNLATLKYLTWKLSFLSHQIMKYN